MGYTHLQDLVSSDVNVWDLVGGCTWLMECCEAVAICSMKLGD